MLSGIGSLEQRGCLARDQRPGTGDGRAQRLELGLKLRNALGLEPQGLACLPKLAGEFGELVRLGLAGGRGVAAAARCLADDVSRLGIDPPR